MKTVSTKIDITLKALALLLVVAIAMPSIVKCMHVFENHEHVVCIDNKSTHMHTLDLDCEFYKFNLNKSISFTNNDFNTYSITQNHPLINSQYFFISEYQKNGIDLRGPPYLM